MRKPVIACGTGGVPEIITHGKDGWLVEERSAEAVATAMTTLLNDRGAGPAHGRAGARDGPQPLHAAPAERRGDAAVCGPDRRSVIRRHAADFV